ncbi:MAG: RhuM family protein, partial [Candidatus Firestonebacteria bacterium]
LNNLVSGYFDFAEIQAMKNKPMYMKDYIKQLDSILSATGEKLLSDAGSVSHKKAVDKAELEYKKYQAKTLSEVEKVYLDTIKTVQKKIEKKARS